MSASSDTEEADTPRPRAPSLGIYDPPQGGGITRIEVAATVLSLLWALVVAGVSFLGAEAPEGGAAGGGGGLVSLAALCVPIALIWTAAVTLRASRAMREESRRLRAAIDAIRQSYIAQNQKGSATAQVELLTRRIEEFATLARRTEASLAALAAERARAPAPGPVPGSGPVAPAQPTDADQPTLALGTKSDETALPLATEDFISALNFPETADDAKGFAALRRALKDRRSAQLVQAAEDVLTLLSQDGIYMDDLVPDRARPETWRQFGRGERGRAIAALGGIHDRTSLALTLGRMKQDPIFRDAAHHFLRLFDRTFAEFEKRASDGEIAALAETRTARAFMLLGRVAGTFD